MQINYITIIAVLLTASCNNKGIKESPDETVITAENTKASAPAVMQYKFTGQIPVSHGYTRVRGEAGSFTSFLRQLPLKKDKTVYLYNGTKKPKQHAQYAVIDIPTGNKDLQQCADVVMRLRAAYLFSQKKYDAISFTDYAGKQYKWQGGGNRPQFERYLENVFSWCGSASLEKQLKPVTDINNLQPGDVFIQGGFPGHAVMVVDMATNKDGKKIYMLVQGYQPAQDMHLLVNPVNTELSPWYQVTEEEMVYTPEWHFKKNQLRRW